MRIITSRWQLRESSRRTPPSGGHQIDDAHDCDRIARVLGTFGRISFSAGPNVALLDRELLLVLNDRKFSLSHVADHVVFHHIIRRLRSGLENDIAQLDHRISWDDRSRSPWVICLTPGASSLPSSLPAAWAAPDVVQAIRGVAAAVRPSASVDLRLTAFIASSLAKLLGNVGRPMSIPRCG